MHLSRRDLIKGVAAGTVGISMPGAASAFSLTAMGSMLSVSPADVQFMPIAPCCVFCASMVVRHYLPVAFIEVIQGPGDSLVTGLNMDPTGLSNQSAQQSIDGLANTMGVRVWEVPQSVLNIAMLGQACKLCDPKWARLGAATQATQAQANSLLETACELGLGVGGFVDGLSDDLLDSLPIGCVPKLFYDSFLDAQWRTGCRDLSITQLFNGAAFLCSASGGGVAEGIMSNLGIGSSDVCVSDWGPLRPRTMFTGNNTVTAAAALTAYRAIHLAGFTTGSFPYQAGMNSGKLQWAYPRKRPAMTPGTTSRRTFTAGIPATPSMRYGFYWWVPVTCCKSAGELLTPLCPIMPCT